MHDFADAPFLFHMPTQVQFGRGCASAVGDCVAGLGKRAMLVTMPDLPFVEQVLSRIESAGVETLLSTQVLPNPRAPMVDAAAAQAAEAGVDVVVGLGGGSAIDTAKAIAVAATHEGRAWEFAIDYRGQTRDATAATLPIVAVPTTSGTGAEVSGVAVISNPATTQKGPIRSPHIFPRAALVDPDLTVSMPRRLTASSGFDAFTHAFERYMSRVRHPMVDALAMSAMQMVVDHLEAAVNDGGDMDARVCMSWASCQSTLCVAAKLGESGLHVLGLPLSAHLDVAHGESMAVFLPHLVADACAYVPEQCRWLARLFGEEPGGTDTLAPACFRGIRRWLARIGLDQGLQHYGVDEAMCRRLAESINVARFENTFYGSRTREQVEAFYHRVLSDAPHL